MRNIVQGCSKDFDNSTVSEFDLSRYLGRWYVIARYDHSFERGMDNTMASGIENTLIYAKMLPSKLVSEIKKLD